jgi:hypothetical protein
MNRQPWLTVGVFVMVWVVVALTSPTRTLHLAPVILGAWPLLGSMAEDPSIEWRQRFGLSAVGILLGVATTTVLALTGGLAGPSLLSVGGATLEAYVFSVVGGTAALVLAAMWREQK